MKIEEVSQELAQKRHRFYDWLHLNTITMTQLRQLQLMKRTAWMNDQLERNPPERPNDARDEQDLTTAMYMLAYLGAIDMALIDLQEELENAGLFKHALKYNFNRVVKTVSKANGLANYILKR